MMAGFFWFLICLAAGFVVYRLMDSWTNMPTHGRPYDWLHPMIGANILKVRKNGCSAHRFVLEKTGVIKKVCDQRDLFGHQAEKMDVAVCGDMSGGEDFYVSIGDPWLLRLNRNTFIWYQ